MKISIIEEKSKSFAIRVVRLYQYLTMQENNKNINDNNKSHVFDDGGININCEL